MTAKTKGVAKGGLYISFLSLFKVSWSLLFIAGSKLKLFIVGVTTLFFIDNIVAIDSTAPAAPSKWPVIDLVELILIF